MTAYIWHRALNRGEPPTKLYPYPGWPDDVCAACGPSTEAIAFGPICTERAGHDGPHVSYGRVSGLLAVWPADHTPADPEQAAEG